MPELATFAVYAAATAIYLLAFRGMHLRMAWPLHAASLALAGARDWEKPPRRRAVARRRGSLPDRPALAARWQR